MSFWSKIMSTFGSRRRRPGGGGSGGVTQWSFNNASGTIPKITYDSVGLPSFEWKPGFQPHYFWRPTSGALGNSVKISWKIEAVSGSPEFKPKDDPNGSAWLSPLFMRKGTYNQQWYNDFYRWFANNAAGQIQPGTYSATVSLDAAQRKWVAVYGQNCGDNADKFNQAKANPSNIGIGFSNASTAGHGCDISGGTVRFTITEFTYQ